MSSCSAGLDPLLGDAVDVAGVQQHFTRADADDLVAGAVRILQCLDRKRVLLGGRAPELRHDHAAVGAVVVDVRGRHPHARQPRAVPLRDVLRLHVTAQHI